jgi:hypothetical protein
VVDPEANGCARGLRFEPIAALNVPSDSPVTPGVLDIKLAGLAKHSGELDDRNPRRR